MDARPNAGGHTLSIATVATGGRAGSRYAGSTPDLLHQLSETMIEAFAWVDLSGKFIDCNSLFEQLLGYSREELLQKTYSEITAPEWRDFERDVVEREVFERGKSGIYEKEYIRKDGTLVPVEVRAALVIAADGQPAGLWGVVRDITERKAARAALEESERRLRDLVESAPFGAHQYELIDDGRLIFVGYNGAADRILGVDHSAFIGKTLEEAFPFLAGDDVPDAYRHVARTGERYDVEKTVYDDQGRLTGTYEVAAFQTGPNRMAALFRDVVERKRAEIALTVEKERYRLLFQSLNDAVFVNYLDDDGRPTRFLEVNDQAVNLLGYSRDELLKRTVLDITVVEDLQEVVDNGAKLLEEGYMIWRGRVRAKSGATIPVEVANHVFRYDDKPAVLSLVRDVTEREEAEEKVRLLNAELEARVVERTAQLEAANRELEAFSYSVSHDLRSPLRAIDGFSRILKEDYGQLLDADGLDLLNRVCESADRMGELVENLLRLSRVSRADLEIREVDLSAVAHEVMGALMRAEPTRRARLEIELGVTADADPALARSLLENLLGNAWKYSGRKPKAIIKFHRKVQENGTVYTVEDNGAGFDPTYAHTLFSAFQRLHSSSEFPGMGIGLAIAERIVRRHGGEIWAESQPGEGAAFHFTLG